MLEHRAFWLQTERAIRTKRKSKTQNMTKNDKKVTNIEIIVRFFLKNLRIGAILVLRERRRLCTIRKLPRS